MVRTILSRGAQPHHRHGLASVQQEGQAEGTVAPNVETVLTGTNLAGAAVRLTGSLSDGTSVDVAAIVLSTAATEVKCKIAYTTGGLAPSDFKLVVTTPAGSVSRAITWSE